VAGTREFSAVWISWFAMMGVFFFSPSESERINASSPFSSSSAQLLLPESGAAQKKSAPTGTPALLPRPSYPAELCLLLRM
jgi:hypothetical protein